MERSKVSECNPYYISKERYLELSHFCRQYNEWKKALTQLDGWNVPPESIGGIIRSNWPESPTERAAIVRAYFSGRISMIDICLEEFDPAVRKYLKRGVTEGCSYDILRANGCPCCRNVYYKMLRKFFWELSRERA